MSVNNKESLDQAEIISVGNSSVSFRKDHILAFKKYAKRRDLLKALLEDGKAYTMDQVDHIISDFMVLKKGE